MTTRFNIPFPCTGNSRRSQMAEGWTRWPGNPLANAQSAGTAAHGKTPRTITVMKAAGPDISGHGSAIVTDEALEQAGLVTTVCGHAYNHCPTLPPGAQNTHWPLADPARATGTEEEIMDMFRSTRDDVKQRVKGLLQESRP